MQLLTAQLPPLGPVSPKPDPIKPEDNMGINLMVVLEGNPVMQYTPLALLGVDEEITLLPASIASITTPACGEVREQVKTRPDTQEVPPPVTDGRICTTAQGLPAAGVVTVTVG